ncbi:Oxysterol-binding protein-related protein 2 [Collichthys lucidus]|uniref:Oxysterol-binding protein n=1 Tax=Collichthys lucidus TaxID=240159 RepID=A0A4V6APM1_COLLU|nr:Oxysterol-binding protein-related protein 2 [Collichthys lucidus]
MSNEDEFYDAVTGLDSDESYEGVSEASFKDALVFDGNTQKNNGSVRQENGIKKHRTSLPAPMFSRNSVSIWSILKKCIGLELSKITMPIVLNEPLSFLQRITEYMEHTYLINRACLIEEQGFRLVSEQVSHHPPVSAFHAESLVGDFVFHGSIYPKLKFWGKSVEAEPKGIITLELLKHNEAYTWSNPYCCVHNIILGKLWIEQYGTVEIVNHSTGDKCVLNFKPCGMFGKELHKVEGYIQDKSKKKHCVIYGKWTECMWSVDPQAYEAHKKSERKGDNKKHKNEELDGAENDDADDMPDVQETVSVVPGSTLLWRIDSRPAHSATMYNFTHFAMSLNELEPGMEATLAPSDCRFRPDIRAMENGNMEEASREKERLEEKQRAARKERAKNDEEWSTRWFQMGTNPYTGSQAWLYTGGYFNRNYQDLPDIY